MINTLKKVIALAGLLLIVSSILPLPASAQTTQFKNDIFSKNWWITQPSKFVNDIFNPTWWKTQPSKFVNDIFNRFWPLITKSKFINDIFNPNWWVDKPSKFLGDIFKSTSIGKDINSLIQSGLNQISQPTQPSGSSSSSSSGKDCWALYDTTCYAKCNSEIDCLKICSKNFAQCMKNNQ